MDEVGEVRIQPDDAMITSTFFYKTSFAVVPIEMIRSQTLRKNPSLASLVGQSKARPSIAQTLNRSSQIFLSSSFFLPFFSFTSFFASFNTPSTVSNFSCSHIDQSSRNISSQTLESRRLSCRCCTMFATQPRRDCFARQSASVRQAAKHSMHVQPNPYLSSLLLLHFPSSSSSPTLPPSSRFG